MDDHEKRKSDEKKKKKRRREETEERQQEAASHGLQISALSSPVDDAAALQKRNEKKARKLLHFQHQDARTGDDPAEKPFFEKKTQSGLQLEGLQNHHLEDERPHKRNATEHTEDQDIHEGELHIDIAGKIKKKKKKKRNNMDAYVSLHREIEQQQEDQHSQEENLHTENNKGEKKSSKKKKEKKREDDGDPHSEEGNPPNKGEEKRSKKKKEKRRKEEKAETPSQKITTESSCGDHELRKEKKARKLAKENGMGGDVFEGVENANDKRAKKAKHPQGTLCKSGGEVGSNGHVKEDTSASSKARKHSKESRNSVESGGYDPTSNEDHDLLRNNIECSKKPLADQLEHVTKNTIVTIDSCPREKEKGKKKERKSKRVTFQDQINVTDQQHVRDIPNAASENSMEIVEEVWGVRFTAEEDEILKDAVWKFIKSKGWDEQEGLNKVFHSMKHKDARNCWADINLSLPHRPRPTIRYRAHLLLEKGAHAGKWSEEEEQLLNRLQGEHGHKWREISALLDRHRTSIKEKWRSLKRMKATGVWTQGELQQLSDMVQKCLRAKASIPVKNQKTDHHILRDDINWEKIADTIGTHNHGSCCGKWYYNLQSSLVTDGLWANEDDLLLLQSLLESGACVEEEVEWDSLLNHRSGQVCLMRWKQMVKHLGENRARQFSEKLDILARRYAPELLESSIEISIENSSIKEDPRGSAKIRD